MQRLLMVLFCAFAHLVAAQPYGIGEQTTAFVDASRSNRQVLVEIFYPADANGIEVPVSAGAFPVVAVGHGFFMAFSAYQSLWNALVPEGFVVVVLKSEGGLAPSHENFGLDLAFVLAEMKQANTDNTSLFFEHIAPTSAIMGHSMGGGASFLGASSSADATTVVTFAPAETTPSAIAAAASIIIPSLIITGSLDCIAPTAAHGQPIFDALASSCKVMVDISGASHCQFADANFPCEIGEVSCPTAATITREQQHNLQFGLVLPWLRYHLLSDFLAWGNFMAFAENDSLTVQNSCAAPTATVSTQNRAVQVWPNPSDGGKIRVTLPDVVGVCDVIVYDALGTVMSKHLVRDSTTEVDLSGFPRGLYYLRVVQWGGFSETVLFTVL